MFQHPVLILKRQCLGRRVAVCLMVLLSALLSVIAVVQDGLF